MDRPEPIAYDDLRETVDRGETVADAHRGAGVLTLIVHTAGTNPLEETDANYFDLLHRALGYTPESNIDSESPYAIDINPTETKVWDVTCPVTALAPQEALTTDATKSLTQQQQHVVEAARETDATIRDVATHADASESYVIRILDSLSPAGNHER